MVLSPGGSVCRDAAEPSRAAVFIPGVKPMQFHCRGGGGPNQTAVTTALCT